MPKKILLTIKAESEQDVLLARRRARQLAFLMKLSEADQMRIAAATSEIARNAVQYATGGIVRYAIDDSKVPISFSISVSDRGPGIANVPQVLTGIPGCIGIRGAQRMMDSLNIDTSEHGTTVELTKRLEERRLPFSAAEIENLMNSLSQLMQENPIDEVHAQNQELIGALNDLRLKQLKLEESEQRLSALSASLEKLVQERTEQLTIALRDANTANELKSKFVANVSHEIRTPLTGVIGMAEVLTRDPSLSADSKEVAVQLFDCCKKLHGVLNDLLDFSKLDAGKITARQAGVQLHRTLESILALFQETAKKKGIQLQLKIDEMVPEFIIGDEAKIRQVILNLMHNAIKFTTTGGVELKAEVLGADLRISVTDTGIGIPEEARPNMFQPFVQAEDNTEQRFGGSGLGLSIAKQFVELMGGKIDYYSELSIGTSFWFCIPLTRLVGLHAS